MERNECFNKISPGLIDSLDLAWQVEMTLSLELNKMFSGIHKVLEYERPKGGYVGFL